MILRFGFAVAPRLGCDIGCDRRIVEPLLQAQFAVAARLAGVTFFADVPAFVVAEYAGRRCLRCGVLVLPVVEDVPLLPADLIRVLQAGVDESLREAFGVVVPIFDDLSGDETVCTVSAAP